MAEASSEELPPLAPSLDRSGQSYPRDEDVYVCDPCVMAFYSYAAYEQHTRGHTHLSHDDPNWFDPTERRHRCPICSCNVGDNEWPEHLISEEHLKNLKIAVLRADLEREEFDRQGVTIYPTAASAIDFGLVSIDAAVWGIDAEVRVSTNKDDPILLVEKKVTSRVPGHASFFTPADTSDAFAVIPEQPLSFKITFRHTELGRYEARLTLTLQGTDEVPFVIARRLVVVVGEEPDHELLKPVARYIRPVRVREMIQDRQILSGVHVSIQRTEWAKEMPICRIPEELREILRYCPMKEISERLRKEYFPGPLSPENYNAYFQHLLWIEEDRAEYDLKIYNMAGVEFIKEPGKQLFMLTVHGLAEKRPSVVIGDSIIAQDQYGVVNFKGVVHEIRAQQVFLDFPEEFKPEGRKYDVYFQLNRTSLRRQHQALLAVISNVERLTFPEPGQEGLLSPIGAEDAPIQLINTSIETNPLQLLAVKAILTLRSGAAPFIVFGPPGTGKTVTIIESINQILMRYPRAKILACAPSNSAADLLAWRLARTLTPEDMFRCNAALRDPITMPPDLASYTFRSRNTYTMPSIDTLMKYKVIVSTCNNASFAYNIGMPAGHWTHIFVDEAAQVSEPEALNAIKPLALDSTRIILSGDPMQLGPVIRSSVARELHMDKSYLERLLERPVYSGEGGRGRAYIKLLQNYRSHKAILDFPSKRFYEGELQVCGKEEVINSYLNTQHLASPKFPVVFHAITGMNEREASSPSYFNIEEAAQVKACITKLLADRRTSISAEEIGVIAPYHAQVRKIRLLLRQASFTNVKVGSVEEFQGQERRVIILSTVRSSTNLLAYDAKFTLGFLSNPRRFNVAITRAKALLIVIGDAQILTVDPLWRSFMNYVYANGGWRGDEPSWDTNASVEGEDYSNELRDAIAAEMSETIAARGPGVDVEAEANMERGWDGGAEL